MRNLFYLIFNFFLLTPCLLFVFTSVFTSVMTMTITTTARGEVDVLVPLTVPEGLQLIDKPNDNGQALMLLWKKNSSANSSAPENDKISYEIIIAENQNGPFFPVGKIIAPFKTKYDFPQLFGYAKENKEYYAFEIKGYTKPNEVKAGEVKEGEKPKTTDVLLSPNVTYYVKVKVLEEISTTPLKFNEKELNEVLSATTKGNWFATNKTNSVLILIFLTVVIMLYIYWAQRNPHGLFIRKIAGLDAMDDAIGRATEMGKMALFVHGLRSVSDVPTIAAMNILGRIARKIAEFDAELKVSHWDPIVQQVSQETVKEAYIEAGRPDAYKEENIFFAAGDQFSYAAAVEGVMVREKPAAIFHFGYFYAESLLLSETGAQTGAIQIAGTDAFTQIPFFITTCDYTLIGEELYAASAYLSREPKLLGGIKGQDVGKVAIIAVLILGTIFTTCGWERFSQLFWP
ncbi:MAG: hypothetical protein HQK49_19410 [Oligoflexia bacterium]|nr:hypothetical protein [Oligoflexia bacterium]